MSLQKTLQLEKPLFLMDGTAFIYRGFYANRTLSRSDGFPTNAIYTLARLLLRILHEEKPEHFIFLMDGKGKNFRHDLFPLYKANRDATPEELVKQLAPIQRMVTTLGIPLEISDGCEADDCIASLVHRHAPHRPVVIIGMDKDLRQCLAPNVWLWNPATNNESVLSAADFTQETGLLPTQWPDVQALIGDSSDNIPGIPGIGIKTAQKIFADFSSLEDIRDGLDRLPPKLHQKIAPHVEDMFLYRQLTTLSTDFCTKLQEEDLRTQALQVQNIMHFLQEFELMSLSRHVTAIVKTQEKLAASTKSAVATSATTKTQQGDLWTLVRPVSLKTPSPITSPRHMPLCENKPVAVLPACVYPDLRHRKGFVIAVAEEEWLYPLPTDSSAIHSATAPVTALCTEHLVGWLMQAERIITPDVKALLHGDSAWHAIPHERWFDLSLAAYLQSPEDRDYTWPRLANFWREYLHLEQYAPALLALDMGTAFMQMLTNNHLNTLYDTLELPLITVLARMENAGIAVDPTAFRHFLHDVQVELDRLTHEVYTAAGTTFNIRSAQQLGDVLFSTLNLPTAGKTKGGQFSTAQEKLEKLSHHPIVAAVLEFRKLEKLRSTYLEPLPKLVDAQGRIHTSFNQLATATGRLSSSSPNLQNIPVRGSLGQRMRTCFVAKPDHSLVSADYSQVELRVLAHMSGDPVLLEAFQSGKDIHASTAALMYDIPLDAVDADQRRNAKTINFGLIYGMGAQKLARELHIDLQEAKDFMQQYFAKLGHLKAFYEGIESHAKECGYVTTLAGRRRLLPHIRSDNGQQAALAKRQAVNTVIQGSAADIIKLAMLAVDKDIELQNMRALLTLQVHDELLLEVPTEMATQAGERMAALMTAVAPAGTPLTVPLVVDWGHGHSWGNAH